MQQRGSHGRGWMEVQDSMHTCRPVSAHTESRFLLLLLLLLLPPDNSRRAFYKEFRKVVEASDVVIQVCVRVLRQQPASTAAAGIRQIRQQQLQQQQAQGDWWQSKQRRLQLLMITLEPLQHLPSLCSLLLCPRCLMLVTLLVVAAPMLSAMCAAWTPTRGSSCCSTKWVSGVFGTWVATDGGRLHDWQVTPKQHQAQAWPGRRRRVHVACAVR
jgi:hypothetical protein